MKREKTTCTPKGKTEKSVPGLIVAFVAVAALFSLPLPTPRFRVRVTGGAAVLIADQLVVIVFPMNGSAARQPTVASDLASNSLLSCCTRARHNLVEETGCLRNKGIYAKFFYQRNVTAADWCFAGYTTADYNNCAVANAALGLCSCTKRRTYPVLSQ